MQERCRNLFKKVHIEASEGKNPEEETPSRYEDEMPDIDDSVSI